MTQFLTTVRLVLSLLPVILDAVTALEKALPASGQGALKLAAIRETLAAAFSVAQDVGVTFDQVWPALEKTTGAVVGLFNKAGAFAKG